MQNANNFGYFKRYVTKMFFSSLRTPTVSRKWDFSYGTSSCITYFQTQGTSNINQIRLKKFGRCDLDDLEMAAILGFFWTEKLLKSTTVY